MACAAQLLLSGMGHLGSSGASLAGMPMSLSEHYKQAMLMVIQPSPMIISCTQWHYRHSECTTTLSIKQLSVALSKQLTSDWPWRGHVCICRSADKHKYGTLVTGA